MAKEACSSALLLLLLLLLLHARRRCQQQRKFVDTCAHVTDRPRFLVSCASPHTLLPFLLLLRRLLLLFLLHVPPWSPIRTGLLPCLVASIGLHEPCLCQR